VWDRGTQSASLRKQHNEKFNARRPATSAQSISRGKLYHMPQIRGPFEKFVEWRECAAFMQREA